MATKRSIADQVLLRISRGYQDSSSAVQLPDVIMAVGQKINELLKTQYLSMTLALGETIPDGLNLATYPDVPVKSLAPYGGMDARAYAELPVMPISLPMGVGVYEVSSQMTTYIPMKAGEAFLLKGQDFISDLLCNVGFELKGSRIIFTKDITVDNVDKVDIVMVISDLSKLSEYDPLPVDAGIEATIVDQLVKAFAPSQTNEDEVDNVDTEKTDRK